MARSVWGMLRQRRLVVGVAVIAATAVGVSVAVAQGPVNNYVSDVVLVTNETPMNSNGSKEVDVYCPGSKLAIGGGSDIVGGLTGSPPNQTGPVNLRRDAVINGPPAADPTGPTTPGTGWRASGAEASSFGGNWGLKVYANCANVGSPGPVDVPPTDGGPSTVGEHWGPLPRNVIGSSVQELRNGPFVSSRYNAGCSGSPNPCEPPFGDGSLGLETKDGTEAASFGNEVDFNGDPVSGLDEVGFRVFTTGENVGHGEPMPNITFEIDPNLEPPNAGINYSSLVFVPDNPAAADINRWSGYIDATSTGEWYLTNGTAANATGCKQSDLCTFSEMQDALDDGGDPAEISTVAVNKGRDTAFVGAVDGLRINNEIFDFELFGVRIETPPAI